MTIGHAEPEGDFSPPTVGSSWCVKSRGGKYSAAVLEVLQVCTYNIRLAGSKIVLYTNLDTSQSGHYACYISQVSTPKTCLHNIP